MHRVGKGDNSMGTAKGLSGGGGARVKGCERPTCMSNPRILKERGRGWQGVWNRCGILRDTVVDRYSAVYRLRSAQDGVGTRRYATGLSVLHPVSSYLDTTFSPASYPITNEARNIFAPRFGEIKNNSFVSVHGYATG